MIIKPDDRHQAYMNDLKEVLMKHNTILDPAELLAIGSQFIGIVITFQNRDRSPVDVMNIVGRNIEIGNAEAIRTMFAGTEGQKPN